jgi:hypothetical protein
VIAEEVRSSPPFGGPLDGFHPLAAAEARVAALSALTPERLVAALRGEPRALTAFLCFAPSSAKPWGAPDWRRALARIGDELGAVDRPLVFSLARRLTGRPLAIYLDLLLGRAPTPALREPVSLPEGARLRFLDKRRDILPFLRFADPVRCCFASDNPSYRGALDTQAMVLSLWKDPLSFCLQIERGDRPSGFVFGGFGLYGRRPVLLLNGVYAKPQTPALRIAIVEALEQHLARPLGLAAVAIGNRFGGYGALPDGYRLEARQIVRLRALKERSGGLVQRIFDDICYESRAANRLFETRYGVSWKDLSAPG